MPSPYIENSANYPVQVTLPDDGDDRNATVENATFEQIVDRTANINSRLTTFLGRVVANDDLHRVANAHPLVNSTQASFSLASMAWTTSVVNVFFTFTLNAFLQHGALLRGVSAPIDVPSDHVDFPTGRNSLVIMRQRNDDVAGLPEAIRTFNDSGDLNLPMFEGKKWLGGYFTPEHTIDLALYSYFAVIQTEYGTNALPGTQVWCPTVFMRTAGALVG